MLVRCRSSFVRRPTALAYGHSPWPYKRQTEPSALHDRPPKGEVSVPAPLIEGALTKRKVALIIGYVGTDFRGLQYDKNPEIRTVEGVLEKALYDAGAIAKSNFGDLSKIGWGRTSRCRVCQYAF